MSGSGGPHRIRLSDERRAQLLGSLRHFCDERFDHAMSEFQAGELLDFLVRELGAPIYNQAIQDARGFMQEKLEDLAGDFYEPEEPSAL